MRLGQVLGLLVKTLPASFLSHNSVRLIELLGSAVIDSKYLISADWVGYAFQTLEYYGYNYYLYIHLDADPTVIGGPFGSQTIYPLEVSQSDEVFIVSSIERLDSFIDLDFAYVGTRFCFNSLFSRLKD